MKNIVVRQVSLADVDALVPLFDGYRQFYGALSNLLAAKQFLLNRFNQGDSVVFMAFQDNLPVGFTQLYPSFSSVSMARVFILNDLFVTEQGRRGGIASSLISAAFDFAKTVGAVRLTLSTAVTNMPAQTLYSASGWKKDEQFFVYNFVTGV
jgi:GNAT superfamily N-acetyltransferase